MFVAQLITVELSTLENGDKFISKTSVTEKINDGIEALIIRTLPNTDKKLTEVYSGNNPAYVEADLCKWLCNKNIKHLVIDLPSVDPEEDGGALSAHHAFWNYPLKPRLDSTITEMAFIDEKVDDGIYLLNIQIASLETDASPSKPVLYKLSHVL